jgi:hypothetical protein
MVSSSKQTRPSKPVAVKIKRRRLFLDFPTLSIRALPFISLFLFALIPKYTHICQDTYLNSTLRPSDPPHPLVLTALHCTARIVLTAQGGAAGARSRWGGQRERACLSQAKTVHASQHLGIGSTTTTMQNAGLRYALYAAARTWCACVIRKIRRARQTDQVGCRGGTRENVDFRFWWGNNS